MTPDDGWERNQVTVRMEKIACYIPVTMEAFTDGQAIREGWARMEEYARAARAGTPYLGPDRNTLWEITRIDRRRAAIRLNLAWEMPRKRHRGFIPSSLYTHNGPPPGR